MNGIIAKKLFSYTFVFSMLVISNAEAGLCLKIDPKDSRVSAVDTANFSGELCRGDNVIINHNGNDYIGTVSYIHSAERIKILYTNKKGEEVKGYRLLNQIGIPVDCYGETCNNQYIIAHLDGEDFYIDSFNLRTFSNGKIEVPLKGKKYLLDLNSTSVEIPKYNFESNGNTYYIDDEGQPDILSHTLFASKTMTGVSWKSKLRVVRKMKNIAFETKCTRDSKLCVGDAVQYKDGNWNVMKVFDNDALVLQYPGNQYAYRIATKKEVKKLMPVNEK